MKRLGVFVIAALVIGMVSSAAIAGSVTSRWDVTLGGYSMMEFQWSNKNIGTQNAVADRDSNYATNFNDKYSATAWDMDVRLNMLMRGPEVWGAKSSAFVEWDFVGRATSGQNISYGDPGLRHAYATFDWPRTRLVMGQTWQPWGYQLPPFAVMAAAADNPGGFKGVRRPQISVQQKLTPVFTLIATIEQSNDPQKNLTDSLAQSDFNRGLYPETSLVLRYQSDACGRIGPAMLTAYASGVWGRYLRENGINAQAGNTASLNASPATLQTNLGYTNYVFQRFTDKTITEYLGQVGVFIPIIPEKAPDNKGGALGLATHLTYSQNGGFLSGFSTSDYNFGTAAAPDYRNPKAVELTAQLGYWYTHKWSTFLDYNYARKLWSKRTLNAQANGTQDMMSQMAANLVYDPSPAFRMIWQMSYVHDSYAKNLYPVLKNHGTAWIGRFEAQYFF